MSVIAFLLGLLLGTLGGWLARENVELARREARTLRLIRELQTEEKVERFDWSSISPLP